MGVASRFNCDKPEKELSILLQPGFIQVSPPIAPIQHTAALTMTFQQLKIHLVDNYRLDVGCAFSLNGISSELQVRRCEAVETSTGSFGVIDFPFEVSILMKELGLTIIGKVYLPRRTEIAKVRAQTDGLRPMSSDCRELLTFEKS